MSFSFCISDDIMIPREGLLMKRAIVLILVLLFSIGIASASEAGTGARVITTGNVKIRTEPSLEGEVLCSVPKGTLLIYEPDFDCIGVYTDDRGVDWYQVRIQMGSSGWVSSKYAELIISPEIKYVSAEKAREYIDVSEYWYEGYDALINALALDCLIPYLNEDMRDSFESWTNYITSYDESIEIGGIETCVMTISGPGYSFCGAAVGMDIDTADECILDGGLEFDYDRYDEGCYCYFRPTEDRFTDTMLRMYHKDGFVTIIECEPMYA